MIAQATPWRCAARSDPYSADSRSNVFAAGPEPDLESNVFQTFEHPYKKMEPQWRELALAQKPAPLDETKEVLRKRLRHQARGRGWMEAAEFLNAFAEASNHFAGMGVQELQALDRLFRCDDMFLMRLVSGKTVAPEELDTPALQRLKLFFSEREDTVGGLFAADDNRPSM